MRFLLAALVGLCFILVLINLLSLGCRLAVVLCSMTFRLALRLLGLIATQAAVTVILGVTVWVYRLQDAVAGAVRIQVGLIGLSRVRDATLNSRARCAGLHGIAFTVIANETVVALLGFAWGTQRVAFLLGRFLITGIGIRVLLPGGGRGVQVHSACCITHSRVRIVGV